MARYLSKTAPYVPGINSGAGKGAGIGIKELKELSLLMREKLGMPFDHLPLSFFKHKLNYVFQKHNIQNTVHFVSLLSDETFREKLVCDFSVEATELFRDPGFWRYLRGLLSSLDTEGMVNVWFPDTASGEEVFSFLIIADELQMLDRFAIFCQHPSGQKLEEIESGILHKKNISVNSSNFKRIECKRDFEEYFTIGKDQLILNKELLKNVETVREHFFNTPAPENTGIIMFRNVMLYYDREMSVESEKKLVSSLIPGGIIAVGTRERLKESTTSLLTCLHPKERIYRKQGFEINWK